MKYIILCSFAFLIFLTNCVCQINGNMELRIPGPIKFIVTDSIGRRCGINPRTGQHYDEIPNMTQGLEGGGDLDSSLTAQFASGDVYYKFGNLNAINTIINQKYRIEIFGISKGMFTVFYGIEQTISDSGIDFNEPAVIDNNQSIIYQITFTTDSIITPTMIKVVQDSTLLQDLDNCSKIGLITDTSFYNTLRNITYQYINDLSRQDTSDAMKDIQQFKQSLDSLKTDTTKIAPDGYNILNEDDSLLIAQLPLISQVTILATSMPGGRIFDASVPGYTPPELAFGDTIYIDTFVVNYSYDAPFSIVPEHGYHIDSLIVDGVSVAIDTSYTFVNVTANHDIRATFRKNQ